ncbi:urease accessory protein UreF [Aquincola sp. S2]|uniref:Urease accessory protein UreF n=1 Tax=Pseudaquabacterium terrae TaxID=2732868 RepID=A0ABX2EE38_9BURK|nr:urease accessory UreF family protein [Aquabacterium terrae]NRF66866.1 urease accessory protein UreF [Aquabacterium terrae]
MRLASPALPVGGFSYSEVLEAAIDAGLVSDEASAGRWLIDHLALGLQRAELPLLAAALAAWQQHDLARIEALNDWALRTRESAELRLQTEQTGRSLADWLRQRQPADTRVEALRALRPAPAWPIAFALAADCSGLGAADALLGYGFGWAENMVQAALKAVPLGQSAGQRLLDALAGALPAAIDAALATAGAGDAARQSFAPRWAILSARHEAQYSRLFRS